MYLAYGVFFLYAGLGVFYAVLNWAEEWQEDKLAPVKLSAWQPTLRSMNPAHWGGRHRCVASQAHVRQAYPVLRRGRAQGKFLVKFSLPGGAFGIRHPFQWPQVHFDVIWYQYEVNGVTHWGKFQFPFGFDTLEEATGIAETMVGKAIPIQFDPDFPEDSKPVFPLIMQMLRL